MISLADQLMALARPTEKILNGRPYARKDDLVQKKINPQPPTKISNIRLWRSRSNEPIAPKEFLEFDQSPLAGFVAFYRQLEKINDSFAQRSLLTASALSTAVK
jgi:hypothetical protein